MPRSNQHPTQEPSEFEELTPETQAAQHIGTENPLYPRKELANRSPGTRAPFSCPTREPPGSNHRTKDEHRGDGGPEGGAGRRRPTSLRYRLWEWRLSTYTSSSGSRPRFPPPPPPEDGGDIAASPLPPAISQRGIAVLRAVVKEAYLSREGAIKAGFVGTDGKVDWPQYYDYVNSQKNYGVMPLYKQEVSVKEVTSDREAAKQGGAEVDETIMKAQFQDWMVEHGQSYRTEKEKARRYEVFKKTTMSADKANSSKRAGAHVAAPNGLADWTDEECECLEFHNFDWEIYIDHINNMAAHGWYIGREDVKQFPIGDRC
ncbi:hypothetical protein C2845_PM05G12840 [Panicum miliaceum]|uniref:Cathepsin propeptide inhibitor domain-containing protein n=1 Tax=Panicum miliaceum TaxID=4540 RepID=A0A3L6SZ21_PANMI|nr:hypothetical protein C2845_PM05G12840 [Panicum miliaceum]